MALSKSVFLLAVVSFFIQPAYSEIKDFEWLDKENKPLPGEFRAWEKLSKNLKHTQSDEESFRSGLQLQNQKKFSEAAKRYAQIVERSPSEFVAWYNLGLCLEQQDEVEKAIEAFKTSTRLNSSMSAAHKHLANCYMKKAQQDLKAASAHWETYKSY